MNAKALLLFFPVISSTIFAEQNTLLRSGPMSTFGDTKIYTSRGIEVSTGKFQDSLFGESKRLTDALTNASGPANPAVANDWQTTEEFEEWTDRLIIKKTTSFTLLDGGRFHNDFFNGTAFTPHENIVPDPAVAPEMIDLAENFIQTNQHLTLYPAARNAGNQGAQNLLDELAKDLGPVTFVETIEFSRIVPIIEDPSMADGIMNSIIKSGPQSGLDIDSILSSRRRADFPNANLPQSLTMRPPEALVTSATYKQEMLNGFTIGNTWSKKISYERSWVTFETSAFATFGIGVRIPWEATVEVGPRRIGTDKPDKTQFDANLSIETLDADEDFYKRVGLPSEHIYDGQEAVLRAGAGITLYLKVLGDVIINRGQNNPLVGKTLDLGKDFDPPLGTTLNLASPELLYEDSGLAYHHWAFSVGGDLKADIGITGQDFELVVDPYKAWTKTGVAKYNKSSRSLQIANENSPESLEFACDDTSDSDGTGTGYRYYQYGAIYSDAQYHTSLDITPKARVRGTLKLSNMIPTVSDYSISSAWIDLFTASFDLPALGPHANTDDTVDAYTRNRREKATNNQKGLNREWEVDLSTNTWSVTLDGPIADITEVLEQLPSDASVDLASITGGGIYDPDTHTIQWNLLNHPEDLELGYDLTTENSKTPTVTGNTRNRFNEQLAGTRTFGTQDQTEALLIMENAVLSQRPTFAELIDARPGSQIMKADEDGKLRLNLQFQFSEDLNTWTNGGTPLSYELDMPSNREFFRFGIQ